MCLLISGKSAQIRATLLNTQGLLKDIFESNSDGVGAMYVTSRKQLKTPKVIPNTLAECQAFIANLPQDDRNLALHFRMKTHGNIDLTNCHPYSVIDGQIALMHNGILSQGNKADPTKSDTWHYIRNVVRPILTEAPKLFMNSAWLSLIEDDITRNNRFAIMDSDGDLVILNKDTGIEHDGMWFSNTYAWSPELLIPGYYKAPIRLGYVTDNDFDYNNWRGYSRGTTLARGFNTHEAEDEDAVWPTNPNEVWEALTSCDTGELTDFLDARPFFTLNAIMEECVFELQLQAGFEPNATEKEIIDLLIGDETLKLSNKLAGAASSYMAKKVAEIMCWYGDWTFKPGRAPQADVPDPTEDEVLDVTTAGVTADQVRQLTTAIESHMAEQEKVELYAG